MSEKSLGRGVIVLAISSIVLKLLSALYVPLLNEIIDEDGFAIYMAAYRVYIFLLVVTSLGLQPAITKVIAEYRVKGRHNYSLKAMKIAKKYLIIYGGIVSLLFAAIAIPLSKIINRPEAALSLIFLSPAIVLAGVLAAYRGYIQGYNEMNSLSISNIIEQVFNVVISLVFAYIFIKISVEFGSAGGTIGTTVGAIGAIIYIRYVFSKRENYSNYVEVESKETIKDEEILRRLVRYAIPITLVSAVQNLSSLMDTVLIGLVFKDNVNILTARLEYFNTIVNVPIVIVSALGIAIFPKIIKGYIEKDKVGLKVQTEYCYKVIYIVIIPSICGLMILSKEIFKFVYNADLGYELLLFGSVVLLFMSISSIQNIILQGMNIFRFIFKVGIYAMLIKLIINIVFMKIDSINVMGAIVGSTVAFAIISIVNHIKLQNRFGIKIRIIKGAIKPCIAAIVMSISIIISRYFIINNIIGDSYTRSNVAIATVILIVIGGAVYGISLLMLGGISKYELDIISPKVFDYIPKSLKRKL